MVGDKFMSKIHLKQTGFNYSASLPSNKSKDKIQKFMQTGDINYIHKNEFDKTCF